MHSGSSSLFSKKLQKTGERKHGELIRHLMFTFMRYCLLWSNSFVRNWSDAQFIPRTATKVSKLVRTENFRKWRIVIAITRKKIEKETLGNIGSFYLKVDIPIDIPLPRSSNLKANSDQLSEKTVKNIIREFNMNKRPKDLFSHNIRKYWRYWKF